MASNIAVLDGTGASQTVKTTDNAAVHTPHHNVDAIIPGTGATNLGKAEDAAHSSGDTGVMALTVRQNTAAALAGSDADYQPLITDSTGRLYVNVDNTVTVASHAVTNAGTFVVQVDGAALTALQLLDDAIFADDAAFTLTSSKLIATGAIRDDSLSTLSAAEGDVVPLRVSSTGALHVTGSSGGGTEYAVDAALGSTPTGTLAIAIRDDALSSLTPVEGDAIGLRVDSTGALWTTISGTVATTQSGTWNITNISGTISLPTGAATLAEQQSQTTALQLLDNIVSGAGVNLTQIGGASAPLGAGVEATALRVTLATDSTGLLSIDDNGGSLTVDGTVTANAGTNLNTSALALESGGNLAAAATDLAAIEVLLTGIDADTDATKTAVQLLDDTVFTDDAAFTPASSKISAVGFAFDDTTPDSVDEGDIGIGRMSANRCQYVQIRDAAGNERGLNIDASGRLTVVGTTTIDDGGASVTIDNASLTTLAGAVSGSEMQVDVVAALPAGTNNIGDVDVLTIAAGTNVIGDVGLAPRTSGGLSVFRTLDLDESEEEIKSSAGQLYKLRITNFSTSPRYVKVYDNTAAGTTVGTTTPIDTIVIPGATSASQPTVVTESFGGLGLAMSTGITVAATTALADADTGAPGANEVVLTAYFK